MDPVNFNAARDMAAYPRAARGYSYDRETGETKRMAYKDVEVMGAAGSINSTTRQMVKWVALHLNEGKVGDTQIISQKMIRECHRHQMVCLLYTSPSVRSSISEKSPDGAPFNIKSAKEPFW